MHRWSIYEETIELHTLLVDVANPYTIVFAWLNNPAGKLMVYCYLEIGCSVAQFTTSVCSHTLFSAIKKNTRHT